MFVYRLMVADDTWMKLIEIAKRRGVSVGRLINLVLRNFVESPENTSAPRCVVCGAEPSAQVSVNHSKTLYLCQQHAQVLPALLKKMRPFAASQQPQN